MSLKRKASNVPLSDAAKKPKANGSITSFFGGPKTVSSDAAAKNSNSASLPAIKFNKEAWLKTLTPEQKELLKLEIDTLHESWLKELRDDITSRDFLELKKFLKGQVESGRKVYPPMEDVYAWSRHTPLNTVKAVILGQDPYHNTLQAHGLAFSVRAPTPAPASLKNIYIALARDYPSFTPPPNKYGDLTPWADRGVLLLNTCLTVRAHEPNSHANRGWEKFTQRVIEVVASKRQGVVFLAWGTPAGKRVGKVDRKRHEVLCSVHPSPLSASRGWFDCGHFRKCNEWLEGRYGVGAGVDWDLGGKKEEVGGVVEEKDGKVGVDVDVEKKAIIGEEKVVVGGIEDDEFEDEDALAAMLEEAEKGV